MWSLQSTHTKFPFSLHNPCLKHNEKFRLDCWRSWEHMVHRWKIHVMHAWILSCFSCVWLFATLWTVAHQAPLSMEFSRREYGSELPYPPLGDLPYPGIELGSLTSPALVGRFCTTWEAPFSPWLSWKERTSHCDLYVTCWKWQRFHQPGILNDVMKEGHPIKLLTCPGLFAKQEINLSYYSC